MNMEFFASDNSGNRTPFHPNMANPVAASGQTQATGTAGDDLTLTVVAGATYALTGAGTAVLVSITGVTSTAANIEWVCPTDKTIIIKIPLGKTTLYFEGDTGTKKVYISRLA